MFLLVCPEVLWRPLGIILQAIAKKLAGYPERARSNMHHARCRVPAAIAHILAQNPQLVAPAVEAFYARDAAGMKAAIRLAHFPPQVQHPVSCSGSAARELCPQVLMPSSSFISPAKSDFSDWSSRGSLVCLVVANLNCGSPETRAAWSSCS